jgi:hypothetical protein
MRRRTTPLRIILLSFYLVGTFLLNSDDCHAGGTLIFLEDFAYSGAPDPNKWIVNVPGEWWWLQGRTHFPNPDPWLGTGEFPFVAVDRCVIQHHTYNPYDLGPSNYTFLGGQIRTVMAFEPTRPYVFQATVRWLESPAYPRPSGLVTSFFTYGYDGTNSDEIDFEFLSTMINDPATDPNSDPALTNTWNESDQTPELVVPEGLVLSNWNTFRIYWCPTLRRITWTWIDPGNGETVLRVESVPARVPDQPMQLYFNFWSPCYSGFGYDCDPWDAAADPNYQPVDDPNHNEISRYEIAQVKVWEDPCEGPGEEVDCDESCADNCPYVPNPGQEDTGGIANQGPDGIGDACQCGDVTGDGKVNSADATMIVRRALGLTAPDFNVPCNCDVTDDGKCDSADATMIVRIALGLTAPLFGNHCGNYTGSCECDPDGNCL